MREALGEEAFNPLFFRSVWPVGVYWIVRSIAGTQAGVLAGFATAVYVFATSRQRSGVIATLALAGMVIVGASAIVGLVFDSDRAYLANDAARDFLMTTVALGSLVIGRPLVGVVAREMSPRLASVLDEGHRLFVYLTLGFALINLLTAAIRLVMLQELGVGQYIVFSRVATFPINVGYFALAAYLLFQAARKEAYARYLRARGHALEATD
jgi:hypothetical protein